MQSTNRIMSQLGANFHSPSRLFTTTIATTSNHLRNSLASSSSYLVQPSTSFSSQQLPQHTCNPTCHHTTSLHHVFTRPTSTSSSTSSPSTSSTSGFQSVGRSTNPNAAAYQPPQSEAERAVNNLLYNIPAAGPSASRRVLSLLVSNESGVLSRISGILAGRGFNIESLVVCATEVPILSRMTVVLDGNSNQVEQARRQLEDLPQIWAAVEFPSHTPVVERELLLVKLSTRPPIPVPTNNSMDNSIENDNQNGDNNGIDDNNMQQRDSSSSSHIDLLLSIADIRRSIQDLTQLFNGRIVDITPTHVMVELTAKSARIDAFINLIKPFGIIELARTGVLAVARGQLDASAQYEQLVASHHDSGAKKPRLNVKKAVIVDDASLPPG